MESAVIRAAVSFVDTAEAADTGLIRSGQTPGGRGEVAVRCHSPRTAHGSPARGIAPSTSNLTTERHPSVTQTRTASAKRPPRPRRTATQAGEQRPRRAGQDAPVGVNRLGERVAAGWRWSRPRPRRWSRPRPPILIRSPRRGGTSAAHGLAVQGEAPGAAHPLGHRRAQVGRRLSQYTVRVSRRRRGSGTSPNAVGRSASALWPARCRSFRRAASHRAAVPSDLDLQGGLP